MPAGYIYIDIFVSAVERNANESSSCMNSLMDQNIQISLLSMKSLIQLVSCKHINNFLLFLCFQARVEGIPGMPF